MKKRVSKRMFARFSGLVVVSSVVVGSLAVSPSVSADEVATHVAVSVAGATTDKTPAVPVDGSSKEDVVVSVKPGESVVVPEDPGQGVSITKDAATVTVGLPGGEKADDKRVKDGTAVYTGAGDNTSLAVQPTSEGVRALVSIGGSDSPSEYRFPITVPEGGSLKEEADGGVLVVERHGVPIVHMAAPWAKDATGAPVPTRYQIEDNTVIQIVNHTANYPVIADPEFDQRWYGFDILFNRSETNDMIFAEGVTGLLAIPEPIVTKVLGALAIVGASYTAWIYNKGECLAIRVSPVSITPDYHNGQYCY
jgi:hypothetical protein